ncbi:hypothetical protein S7711_10819 [Stachybotrys chartarum IBT 7711]|uniref:Uncharacterized protein n=1 Tax=Stachybotrys chartarum (strain CBS 109288 / IBT 7711) TaxID=1280523 RepID=A0A084AIJ9_STACB|nr:hypothetical protein S7711_10819 [Stachybotrys chartarum IBT 7711]
MLAASNGCNPLGRDVPINRGGFPPSEAFRERSDNVPSGSAPPATTSTRPDDHLHRPLNAAAPYRRDRADPIAANAPSHGYPPVGPDHTSAGRRRRVLRTNSQ